jgi:DmsE family decaheme c-type cytochrome
MKTNIAIGLLALAIVARAGAEMSARPPAGAAPVNAAAATAPTPVTVVGVAMTSATQASAPPAGYAGSDTCLTCHSDKGDSLKGTPHGQAKNPRAPEAAHGCESCHGPGQAHVDDDAKGHIVKFAKVRPEEVNQTCLTCHNRGAHAGWEGSTHERRNLSCITCHSVHSPKSETRQLIKATEAQTCVGCHRLQVAKTERAVAHMPVREGKMQCSSCHNPHGSIGNVKALRVGTSVNETCYSCHAEMRARRCGSTRRSGKAA